MAVIKPNYLNLQELSIDSLTMAEEYLNGVKIEDYTVKELTQLAPILIDLLTLTYTELPLEGKPNLKYRVHKTSLALIADTVNELEKIKKRPELTRNADYVSTIRILGKLHKAAEDMCGSKIEHRLDVDLSDQDLVTLGLADVSESS